METDWSVAAGGEDPLIETDWFDESGSARWVDLRVAPDLQAQRIAELPEARQAPELGRFLQTLNAPDGLTLTTKSDLWALDSSELVENADLLDVPDAAFGFASYVDVLFAHAAAMADFLLHEEWARTTARRCAAAPVVEARLELIVRPARSAMDWGFGLTVYCYGVGASEPQARAAWARALETTAPVLLAVVEELLPMAGDAEARALQ